MSKRTPIYVLKLRDIGALHLTPENIRNRDERAADRINSRIYGYFYPSQDRNAYYKLNDKQKVRVPREIISRYNKLEWLLDFDSIVKKKKLRIPPYYDKVARFYHTSLLTSGDDGEAQNATYQYAFDEFKQEPNWYLAGSEAQKEKMAEEMNLRLQEITLISDLRQMVHERSIEPIRSTILEEKIEINSQSNAARMYIRQKRVA